MKNSIHYYFLAVFSAIVISANADQVILDDLIVDGSQCLGFDCVNGESFGFDTLRLKENNLRIKFDDTSVAANFPRNDWQITINDSANGGRSKFAIEDITRGATPFTIEANAPAHSLYVEDYGRIGLKTSTPVTEIHSSDGDTPTLRLEQSGASGWAPQTWDIAGNETNFFIRDASNGSTLPFRIRPEAPTDSILIDSEGNVGFGTSNPAENIDVIGTGSVRMRMSNTDFPNDGTNAESWIIASNGLFKIIAQNDGGVEMELDASGNMTIGGTITASGSAFPDYVFEDTYSLRSLDEVNQYIEANGHLPGIPSAEEVDAQGGHNMTKLQMALLEKVEELTLYTIEQESRISELEAKVNALMTLLD